MKSAPVHDTHEGAPNPLDGYERFLKSRKARFQRIDSESLVVDVEGHNLELYWNEDDEAMLCSCSLGMKLIEGIRDMAAPVVMHINRRQWLGHFEISEEGTPCWRYTMLFHGNVSAADNDVIEEMTDIAVRSCEQYAPAFALMAAAQEAVDFPRIFEAGGQCAPLGLALLDISGEG
jgi:hypothetical protein